MMHKFGVGLILIVLLIGVGGVSGQQDDEPEICIHSSGYYQVLIPSGNWDIYESTSANWLNINATNADQIAVIRYAVTVWNESDATLHEVSDDYLTEAYYDELWGDYDEWSEISRDITDTTVRVDFDLLWQRDTQMVARDVSWVEDGRLYTVQFIVPKERHALLNTYEQLLEGFVIYPELQRLPVEWPVYFDPEHRFMFKYPPTMHNFGSEEMIMFRSDLEDSPTFLIVRNNPNAVGPLTPETWIPQTAQVLSSIPVTRSDASGYEIIYDNEDTAEYEGSDVIQGLLLLQDETSTIYNVSIITPETINDSTLAEESDNAWRSFRWGLALLKNP